MKMFKKILAGVVFGAVVASALAVPMAALSDTTMSHVRKGGKMTLPNGKIYCTYSTDTAASSKEASATASSSRALTMSAEIHADGLLDAMPAPSQKNGDAIFGTHTSVSVDNKYIRSDGTIGYGRFLRAIGKYNIASNEITSSVDE